MTKLKFTDEQVAAQQALRATYRDHENAKGFTAFQLAAELSRKRPDLSAYQVALDAAQIVRLSGRIASLALRDCNYGLSERQNTNYTNTAARIQQVAEFYGLVAHCSGDPRGFVVRLTGDIKANGWGEGFGVA